MNKKFFVIVFNLRIVLFFIALETLTVPLVAMSNKIATQAVIFMAIMGFVVAFIIVMVLLRMLKQVIINNSLRIFAVQLSAVHGVWYLGVLAGILEMIMFVVQDLLFARHWDDYRVGFASAFISVGLTLIIYQLGVRYFKLALVLVSATTKYTLQFAGQDIFKLALLFGIYELIVCPITGWWIPYQDTQRLMMAIFSGIVGGGSGGLLLYLITRFIPWFRPKFHLVSSF